MELIGIKTNKDQFILNLPKGRFRIGYNIIDVGTLSYFDEIIYIDIEDKNKIYKINTNTIDYYLNMFTSEKLSELEYLLKLNNYISNYEKDNIKLSYIPIFKNEQKITINIK